MVKHFSLAVVLVLWVTPPASAQTSDDFFDPNVLQRIELWLNDADWASEPKHADDNRWLHRPRMDWRGAERRIRSFPVPSLRTKCGDRMLRPRDVGRRARGRIGRRP